MRTVRYALLADGPTDEALTFILTWLLHQHLGNCSIVPIWPDLSADRPARRLRARIVRCAELYPCDVLFIHRDAENQEHSRRVEEITRARDQAGRRVALPPVIPVVPVRMTEAWLLADETAIRQVAKRPRRRDQLSLPRIRDLERLPNPKALLRALILDASGSRGRRRGRVRVDPRQVAAETRDFSSLRVLPAFQALEADIARVVQL